MPAAGNSEPPAVTRTLGQETARADTATRTNQQLRSELSRARQLLDGQRAVTKRVTRTEQDLAHAHELLAGQGADVHEGHQALTEVHGDAVELARMVALNFKARRWAGYQGPVRDLVERYVQTGQ